MKALPVSMPSAVDQTNGYFAMTFSTQPSGELILAGRCCPACDLALLLVLLPNRPDFVSDRKTSLCESRSLFAVRVSELLTLFDTRSCAKAMPGQIETIEPASNPSNHPSG